MVTQVSRHVSSGSAACPSHVVGPQGLQIFETFYLRPYDLICDEIWCGNTWGKQRVLTLSATLLGRGPGVPIYANMVSSRAAIAGKVTYTGK